MAVSPIDTAIGISSSHVIGSILKGMFIPSDYASLAEYSMLIPGIEGIIALDNAQLIKGGLRDMLYSFSGVNMGQWVPPGEAAAFGIKAEPFAQAWQLMRELAKSRPSLEMMIRAWHCGLLGDNREVLNRFAQIKGAERASWTAIEPMLRNYLGIGDLITLRNRSKIFAVDMESDLKRSQAFRPEDLDRIENELRYFVPGSGEISGMESRLAFSFPDAARLGLFDEFDNNAAKWHEWNGMNRPLGIVAPANGGGADATWPMMRWAAHWIPIGVGQVYEMLHRCRPDNVAKFNAAGIKAKVFTLDDAELWMKYEGYPAPIRENLKAIAYKPISLRYAKSMYVLGGQSRELALSNLLDNGYNASTSEEIIKSWDFEILKKELDKLKKKEDQCLKTLESRLYARIRVGLDDVNSATVAMQQAGMDAADASNCLLSAQIDLDLALAKSTIARIRSEYLTGLFNIAEVLQALLKAGVVPSAAGKYAASWEQQLTLRRKTIGIGKVLKWYKIGLVSRIEAGLRLNALGYADYDTALMLADTDVDIMKQSAKEQQIANKNDLAKAKALHQIQKKAASQFTDAQKALRKVMPISRIAKLLKEGKVSAQWAQEKLVAEGEPAESIALYLTQWGFEDEALAVKAQAAELKAQEATAKLLPLADLKGLLSKGIISPNEFALNLAERGFDDASIAGELALADAAASAAAAKQTAAAVPVA